MLCQIPCTLMKFAFHRWIFKGRPAALLDPGSPGEEKRRPEYKDPPHGS